MTGTRLAIRVWRERSSVTEHQIRACRDTKHVLIVGVNRLAEVYVRAMTELGGTQVLRSSDSWPTALTCMVGYFRSYKVLGVPEDLVKVAQELEVHGTWLDRVVVTEDLRRLSPARAAGASRF